MNNKTTMPDPMVEVDKHIVSSELQYTYLAPCGGLEHGTEFITTAQAEAYADARVRAAQQWHPIETVPEEGPYLVYGGQLAGEAPDLLENLDVIKVNGRVFGDTNFKKSDVVFDVSDAGYSWILILTPTHWMPLPPPPTK